MKNDINLDNLNNVLNELNIRLNLYKALYFKPHSLRKDIKTYKINDKYSKALTLIIERSYDVDLKQPVLTYSFESDNGIIFSFSKLKMENDFSFVKEFFIDFYDLILSETNIEAFYEVKKEFLKNVSQGKTN